MLRFKNANEFVDAISLLVNKNRFQKKSREDDSSTLNNTESNFKMGQVDPSYGGSGRPRIIFEGETEPSLKAYPYLSSYAPKAGDTVLMARVGNSYIILGKRV